MGSPSGLQPAFRPARAFTESRAARTNGQRLPLTARCDVQSIGVFTERGQRRQEALLFETKTGGFDSGGDFIGGKAKLTLQLFRRGSIEASLVQIDSP